jgi:4-amino-4-deoxy-L-arabinose transferase-like glycosyltransferase
MPEHATADTRAAAPPDVSTSPFDRRVLVVGVVVFAVLMARVSLSLFGVSAPGLRLWSALASGTTVVIGGLTAREFGGGRSAQLLAAVAVATMPALLGSGYVANATSYMILACAGLALIVARIGRTGETRWWLAGGAVAGIGAEDNHLVGILAVALTVCALLSGGHRMVLNRWFLVGAAIAVALLVPDLWWQADHDWATITMTHALNHENGGPLNVVTWIFGQLGIATLATVWVWAAGLRFLWRSGRPPLSRPLL